MSFVVKNTTKWGLLDLVCPHTCRGCGELGAVLCERCKKNIITARVEICPICRKIVAETAEKSGNIDEGLCEGCNSLFRKCWVVGWREGALAKLVKDFKYESVRAIGKVLAEMLDETLPKGMEEMVVVPLPTIGRHVRERGLDHTKILGRNLAKRRGWKCEMILGRVTDSVQVGAKAAERKRQASETYEVVGEIDPKKRYLLVDDVWTTGATMQAAAKTMLAAGAKEVYGAVTVIGRPEN